MATFSNEASLFVAGNFHAFGGAARGSFARLNAIKIATTTAIVSPTPAGSEVGSLCAVTYAVSPATAGSGAPGGTVTVSDGTNSCTGTLPASSCNLPSVAVGTASLTAGYSGDSIYDASVSTSTLREIAPVGQIGSISVSLAGNGSGSVTSVDGRITCGATCSGLYSNTTVVTLNAVPGGGRAFSGWLGACTGVDPCVITVNGASSVSATFAPATPALNFDIDGNANARALTYLNNLRPMLDIGGDGQVDAMTDGVTLLRYLIGVRGNALMLNAVSAAPRRTSATSIEDYVQAYLP